MGVGGEGGGVLEREGWGQPCQFPEGSCALEDFDMAEEAGSSKGSFSSCMLIFPRVSGKDLYDWMGLGRMEKTIVADNFADTPSSAQLQDLERQERYPGQIPCSLHDLMMTKVLQFCDLGVEPVKSEVLEGRRRSQRWEGNHFSETRKSKFGPKVPPSPQFQNPKWCLFCLAGPSQIACSCSVFTTKEVIDQQTRKMGS